MIAPTTPAKPIAYSGLSVAAMTVAFVSVVGMAAPALGLVLAIAGVWLALRSRRELRDHPELGGWELSLGAMIVSSLVLLGTLATVVAPFVMSVVFLMLGCLRRTVEQLDSADLTKRALP
ncbi:hypothetical protein [Microcella sp.]|uniref:hypothetical protein n=1 Tax=Microcella sp. TaxID=1913979 RepID=UPI00299F6CAB|nr:hypothetical protein [Microcella sp.]MDX2025147.1 hypothetical protein [Microcella sp.]